MNNTSELIKKSQWLRREIFNLVVSKQRGHIPSSFSMNELLIALYYGGFVNYPKDYSQRDRVIVSKGHASLALYPILIDKGLVSPSETAKFADANGKLRMYADPSIPGIESVTGSLGHGLGIGCGYALAAKLDEKHYNTYVILGDGECYEGSVWETLMFASHQKLNNFCVLVDRNQLCITGETEKCLQLDPLDEKFRAFGFDVQVVDGHRYREILPALNNFVARKSDCPTAIIAKTIKGKGVSFMENNNHFHGVAPTKDETARALKELGENDAEIKRILELIK